MGVFKCVLIQYVLDSLNTMFNVYEFTKCMLDNSKRTNVQLT